MPTFNTCFCLQHNNHCKVSATHKSSNIFFCTIPNNHKRYICCRFKTNQMLEYTLLI